MLKTVKSKILAITLLLLFVLSLATFLLALDIYKQGKILKKESCALKIAYFAEDLNKIILQFQENAKDLAASAEMYYNFDKTNYDMFDYIVKRSFEQNDIAIGGGVWFEPYKIHPKKIRFCTYAFFKDGKLLLDENSEDEKYNYLNASWYNEIKEELSTENPIVWVTPYVDKIGSLSYMTTVGVGVYDRKGELVGVSTVDWSLESILQNVSKLRPSKDSLILFADKSNDFVLALNDEKDVIGKPLKTIPWYNPELKSGEEFNYKGIRYITFIQKLDNSMTLVVNLPKKELFQELRYNLELMLGSLLLACIFIAALMYFVLTHNINKPIAYLAKIASEIGEGKLDTKADLKKPEEFAKLAQTLNKMTSDVKDYITTLSAVNAERKQMEFELKTAKAIQYSALPNVFPPYPDHKEFEIFASMDTAKEVGGDFYDFFFTDPNHFAFLVADVSGKGVPAALFMMKTKTVIKNLAKTGLAPDELMEKVNKKLCKNNEQAFFVTVFFCVMELSSGKLTFVNAGHNLPLIKKSGEKFEYLQCEPNFVLGGISNIQFKSSEIQLKVDESILLYTDGVTEAVNKKLELYGEDRLIEFVNKSSDISPERLLKSIKSDIDEFSQGEEQVDDITMLGFKYKGVQNIMLPANTNYLCELTEKIEQICNELRVKDADRIKLMVAAEEIFVNISNYAYPPKEGDVEIAFKHSPNEIEISFKDWGVKYNPLENPEPDITLSAEERPIGGLGIFMVKQSMDYVDYVYENGQNILTIKMNFER